MKTCQWQEGYRRCGSYAFNLRDEGIDQGEYCDKHYWQDQAKKATLAEREACAVIAYNGCLVPPDGGSPSEAEVMLCDAIAKEIRARK